MDAVSVLERQHAQIKNLFDELSQAVEAERSDLVDMLADELIVHMALEETYLYPATAPLRTAAEQSEALDEHHKLRVTLVALLRSPTRDVDFPSKLARLQGDFLRHAGDEEAELFPRARERLGPDAMRRLAHQMRAYASDLHGEAALQDHLLDEVPPPSADPGEQLSP